MSELIVITGPPGAGKTTVAEHLVQLLEPSALVSGDEFFAFLRRGFIQPWLAESASQNTAVIEAAASAAGRLSDHCHVIYDGVVGPWFLSAFLRASRHDRVHYVLLLPPLDACLDRVRTRQRHGFTDLDAARHMHRQFEDAARPAHLAARHVLTDTRAAPDELAAHIRDRVLDSDSYVVDLRAR